MNRTEARDYIRKNLDCRDYLTASYKAGRDMYCCPYCGSGEGANHTGALKYYGETNTWTCHACQKSGDVLDLLQKNFGIDYSAALMKGADLLGISIDAPERGSTAVMSWGEELQAQSKEPQGMDGTAPKTGNRAQGDKAAGTADFTAYYRECAARLSEDKKAQDYLKARGISMQTAETLLMGYDPAADPASAPGALEAEQIQKLHPAPRIIIPTAKNHYVARAIDSKTPKEYAKMNPSTKKGAGSPGILNAECIYTAKSVFVLEGWADAASVIECGGSAIALNSAGNGELLLKMLREKPSKAEFIICFDNDESKTTAERVDSEAEKLLQSLQMMGYKAIRYNLAGTHKDVNDALIADGTDQMRAAIVKALKELHRDYLTDFLEKIQTEAYKPCETDLQWFDDLLGGGIIQQSLLLLLAAPGVGKTTLCQQLAESMATHGKPVIYLNLEMSREQMLAKAISCRLSRKGYQHSVTDILQGYSWDDESRKEIVSEIEAYRKESYPFIQYNPGAFCSDVNKMQQFLTETGERAKQEGHAGPAIVLDYLQLLSSSDGADLQQVIKEAVISLKDYARTYNTFVIGIVATNRDSNRSGRISLSSGRDSSNIEYTADYQLSLNYEDIDNGKVKPDDAEAIADLQQQALRRMVIRVLKNRFSLPGKKAMIYFDAAHNSFYPQGRTEAEDGAIKYAAEHGTAINII